MKRMITILLAVLTGLSVVQAGSGKKLIRPAFDIVRIDRPVDLSGKLDDPLWEQAETLELLYEVTPGDNTPAPQRTLVKILYDDANIYFGFRCYDTEPEKIRANLTERDNIFQDDYVIVCIDTYGDHQKAYELAVNPFGVQGDLMASMNDEDINFDAIWESAAAIDDQGWTAEMKVPFKSIRFPKKDVQSWALNIIRTLPRSSRIQVSWTPIDRDIPSLLAQSGLVRGLEGIESSGTVELLPYGIAQSEANIKDPADGGSGLGKSETSGRIGLGFSYIPGSNFSLDGVINPDFSQIESDAAQISVNTTFALYYPEKRPFFLKGNELLQTPMYYSRSINDPLAAGRVIGKNGSLSYMYLTAYDRNTVIVVPGLEQSSTVASNRESFANIARLRYDLGDESYIGGMMLARNISDAHNYVFGLDWNYRFWGNWSFSGEGFYSDTQELNDPDLFTSDRDFGGSKYTAGFDGENYSGMGVHLVLQRNARHYGFYFLINDFNPTYQTYNGFFTRINYRQYLTNHSYTFYPKNSFIDRGTIGVTAYQYYDYSYEKREQVVQPSLSLTTKGQINVNLSYLVTNDELFRDVWFDGINRMHFSVSARPHSLLNFGFSGQLGRFIYRTSSPVMGKGHTLEASLTLKPTTKLNMNFSYSRARLSDLDTDALFYDGDIYRTVIKYQFTPEIMFRTIAEYNSFSKNFNIYPLFSYKAGAFTTFYAGMSNNSVDYGNPFGFTTTNRQYFIKMQYMIRT
ncbi:hypothetical protein JXO52_11830 [bacterium]|nr:hypothetical protein [bacterium]